MNLCNATVFYIKVQLILFLNKCDILERKLARGVSLKRYIPTYGDRKNDMPTASKCSFISFSRGTKSAETSGYVHTDLRNQFLEIARKQSPEPRTVHCFMTTAIVRMLPISPCFYLLFIFRAFLRASSLRTLEPRPKLLRQSVAGSSMTTYKVPSFYADFKLRTGARPRTSRNRNGLFLPPLCHPPTLNSPPCY
jgi:hypothetical protein